MTTQAQPDRIIISDNEGNYYLLSKEILEQAKVTGDQAAEVKELVDGGSGDTQGFVQFAATTQYSPALTLGASQFALRGACACSFSCGSFDRGARVINPARGL